MIDLDFISTQQITVQTCLAGKTIIRGMLGQLLTGQLQWSCTRYAPMWLSTLL